MKKQKKSKFLSWFIAKHGERPYEYDTDDLYREICDLEHDLYDLKFTYDETRLWDAQHASALYAWNVKDGKK